MQLENQANYKIKDNVIICANLNDHTADNTTGHIAHFFQSIWLNPWFSEKHNIISDAAIPSWGE